MIVTKCVCNIPASAPEGFSDLQLHRIFDRRFRGNAIERATKFRDGVNNLTINPHIRDTEWIKLQQIKHIFGWWKGPQVDGPWPGMGFGFYSRPLIDSRADHQSDSSVKRRWAGTDGEKVRPLENQNLAPRKKNVLRWNSLRSRTFHPQEVGGQNRQSGDDGHFWLCSLRWKWQTTIIIEDLGARSKYLGHGWLITFHRTLYDVTTYPCFGYLRLA